MMKIFYFQTFLLPLLSWSLSTILNQDAKTLLSTSVTWQGGLTAFLCFNAHKHLLQKGDLAGVYRWPWCGKSSLKEVVNVPAIFFRRSAASQASCTVEWRWRRTVYCLKTVSPRNARRKTARFSLLLFCLLSFFTSLTCIQMLISEKFSWQNQPHRLGFSLSCFPWNGNFIPSWSEWGQETGKIFCSACAKWD